MAVPRLECSNSSRETWWEWGLRASVEVRQQTQNSVGSWPLQAVCWGHQGNVSIPLMQWNRVREKPRTMLSVSFQIHDQNSRGPFTVVGFRTFLVPSPTPLIIPYLLQSAASFSTHTLRDGPPPVHGGNMQQKGPPEAPILASPTCLDAWPVLVSTVPPLSQAIP